MPLKIGGHSSSRSLITWEKYQNRQLKAERDTRIDQAAMEWLIHVSGGVTYCIKFSGNFHKKHLYTSTKKLENVQAEYAKLASIADDDARWTAAQESADETKFRKQLGHRSRVEQDCVCGHSIGDHDKISRACSKITKLLEFPPGKKAGDKGADGKPVKKGFVDHPCSCTKFSNAYEEKRDTIQGKPSINPLLGATTAGANDVIWMDKIPRAVFESVIVAAIQKRLSELNGAGKSWGAGDPSGDNAEHVEWDFGAAQQGCILKIDKATRLADAKARNLRSVEVLIKMDHSDPQKPVFTVCHLDGKKTK